MTWLDGIFIVILVICAIGGLRRGLLKLVFAFIAIFLGVVVAGRWCIPFGDRLGTIVGEGGAQIVAFIIIFLITVGIVWLLGRLLRKRITGFKPIGWGDRLGGVVFGLAIGGIICGVIITLLGRFIALPWDITGAPGFVQSWLGGASHVRQSINTALQDSALTPPILRYFTYLLKLLPSQFEAVRQFFG
jgi:uncharacterized membrane protein required for colicin V production